MLDMIKDKIWNLLKEKEISLAMIFDGEGRILWHKGRHIIGRDVFEGDGFCKSYIHETLENPTRLEIEDVIKSDAQSLSRSAVTLLVKSVVIHPIAGGFFLYLDSGKKASFSESDRISFRILGELLEQIIQQVRKEADDTGLTGKSPALQAIREQVVKYSLEEDPVLLNGETGVGKNHIAGLIHRYSGRKGKFVVVDTPNIQDNLFESKLFGHKKGAFTDAKFDKVGLVQEAEGGTLFFDEITEVPVDVQAKLLRFLDTKSFYVLGESTERQADVRIIAATNRDLEEAVAEKEFRRDLYYRLNVLEIGIPPLRERKEDVRNLVEQHLDLLRGKELGEGFWEVVLSYTWPGNVREVFNFMKRAGIMLDAPVTGAKVRPMLKMGGGAPGVDSGRGDRLNLIRERIANGESFWDALWRPFIDRDLDRETVKEVLRGYYIDSSHNFRRMLTVLNVDTDDYRKFMSLLYKYKIDPRHDARAPDS